MAVPIWLTGQVLSASDINNWFVPVVAYKTSDTARASSTTATADPDLQLGLQASAFYKLEAFFIFEGSNTANQGLKFNWIVPTGTTLRSHNVYSSTAGVATVGVSYTAADNIPCGTNGAGSLRGCSVNGSVFTSTTSGSLVMQWAQNVSEASTVTLHAQSAVTLTRMG